MADAPIIIKLFTPLTVIDEKGAYLPPYEATVGLPPCLLVQHPASPAAKIGYLKTQDREALFVICEKCAAGLSDAELEQKIIANLLDVDAPAMGVGSPPVMAVGGAPAKHGAWAERAARDWVKPLTTHQ